MKLFLFFYSFIFILTPSLSSGLKDKVTESEENTNFLGESLGGDDKEKKLIVEVEPADYENDFIDSLRDQEDADRKFGMDDLGMIIEKVTKNRYYPYPPTMPISGSQFMLPNLIGSPYLGPYTQTNQQSQQNSPRFKEKFNNETRSDITNNEIVKINKNVQEVPQFRELEKNLENKSAKNSTAIDKIEEKILNQKLQEALQTLNELNRNAKAILKKEDVKNTGNEEKNNFLKK